MMQMDCLAECRAEKFVERVGSLFTAAAECRALAVGGPFSSIVLLLNVF